MDINKADILKRLQSGESIEDIAKEMSTALNDAKDEFEILEAKRIEEEKNAEMKRAEENRIYAAKREAVCSIIDGFSDFLIAAGAEDLVAEMQNVDPDKMVRMFDEMIECAQGLERLTQLQFPRAKQKVVVRSDDEVLKQFLKDMFG
jgi:secreted Zn-dependent insulinase-like peptidase